MCNLLNFTYLIQVELTVADIENWNHVIVDEADGVLENDTDEEDIENIETEIFFNRCY